MTVITPTELALLRTRPHKTRLFLSIYQPATVFAAQVNNASAAKGDTAITYNNVITGTFGSIVAGMTMYVGTIVGGRDLGRIRVRSATATVVTVAENKHIEWADDVYLTAVKYYEPWAVYPRITLDADNNATFYKDDDVVYVDQNDVFDPVPMMGPHLAGILDEDTVTIDFYFDGSDSYDLNAGGSISSYAWTFEGGTPNSSSAAAPGNITWATPGHYVVSLAVTNNNGKSFTARRHVSVYTSLVGSDPPIVNWGIDSLNGDYARGSWEGELWIRETVDKSVVCEGAQVVIFADDWYGDTKQSIGGNYPTRENIVFVGYVRDGSVDVDPETSVAKFAVTNLAAKLDASEVFSVSVVSKADPTTWYEVKNMTVDIALYHYLRWHTTVHTVADIQKNGDTLYVQYADFERAPMYTSVNGFISSTLLGRFIVDRQGQGWLEKKIDIVEVGDRAPGTALTLTRADWRDLLTLIQRRELPVSYAEVGGISYEGTGTDVFAAYISCAPGLTPGYEGKVTVLTGTVLESQIVTNQLVGNVLANLNKEFPELRLQLSGNYRLLDIAPQERILVTLSSSENWLGVSLVSEPFIPRQVSISYSVEDQTCLVDVLLEQESDGPTGEAGPYPAVPPDDPPEPCSDCEEPPCLPPCDGVEGTGDNCIVVSASFVAYTENFLSSSPNYVNKTGGIAGSIIDYILDPFDPANTHYALTVSDIWRTTNFQAISPTWTSIGTAATLLGTVGGLAQNPQFRRIRGNIHDQGGMWVLGWAEVIAALQDSYALTAHTHNGGDSWSSQINIGQIYDGNSPGFFYDAFDMDQHTANRLFVSAKGFRLFQSTDGGHTWGLYVDISGGFWGIRDIRCPYVGNDSGDIVWMTADNNLDGDPTNRVYRYDSTRGLLDTGLYTRGAGKHFIGYGIDGLTFYVLVRDGAGDWNLYRTIDEGSTSIQMSAGLSAPTALGVWPYNSNRIFLLQSNQINYSIDGGTTLLDKTGDWATVFGGAFANPVMIVPIWISF